MSTDPLQLEVPEAGSSAPIGLRALVPSDYEVLFHWRTEIEALPLWNPKRHPVSREQFDREFRDQENGPTHVRFMITADSELIGTVFSYHFSALHDWTYIGLYVKAESRGLGLAVEAARQFMAWLFANYPLRKIYSEIFGFNLASLAVFRKAGLEPAAVLEDHLYWQGDYHDLVIFSITRELFFAQTAHPTDTNSSLTDVHATGGQGGDQSWQAAAAPVTAKVVAATPTIPIRERSDGTARH